jgi:predicted phage tail component-like protein
VDSFSFKGVTKGYVTVTTGRKRPPFAPVKRNFLFMPNRPGAYLQNTQTDVRVLHVPVLIQSDSYLNLQKIKEDFAEWLVSDKPEELIFPDEIDRIYYAVVDGSIDLDEIVSNGEGTISFICPDPYKYGPEKKVPFKNGDASLNYYGTVDTYPIIQTTISKPTTFLSIKSGDKVMLIGQPSNVEVTPVNPTDSVLSDMMDSLTGWTQSSITLDGGVKSGTLAASGGSFFASDYGSGSTWHGPAMQKNLSEETQDFQIDITCKFETTTAAQIGRLEVYLVDVNNKIIGKLALKDYTNNSELTMPEIIVRNDTKSNVILERNMNDVYDNWYGVLRLKRVGNEFWASTIRVDPLTGKIIETAGRGTKERYFLDSNNEFQSRLSSIVVHFAGSGAFAVPALNQIHEISVVKYNPIGVNEIAYIAQPGDEIELNFQESTITRNGESILYEKDLPASFFPIHKGLNTLTMQPSDSVTGEVIFREKFL